MLTTQNERPVTLLARPLQAVAPWLLAAAMLGAPLPAASALRSVGAPDSNVGRGEQIAYTGLVGGVWQIHLHDLGTQETVQLTTGPLDKRYPAWSPDGEALYFCDSNGSLYRLDVVKQAPPLAVLARQAPLAGTSISAVGRIAFSRVRRNAGYQLEVWTADASGRSLARITRPGHREQCPAWSPNGRSLLVARYTPESKTFALALLDDLGNEDRVLAESDQRVTDPAWFPDGSAAVFSGPGPEGDLDLWRIDIQSGKRSRLTRDPAVERDPSVNGDGSKIAFVRNGEEKLGIWILDLAEGHVSSLSLGGDACREPTWRPSSQLWPDGAQDWSLSPRAAEPAQPVAVGFRSNGDGQSRSLAVFTPRGTVVRRGLAVGQADEKGRGTATWDGRDVEGHPVPPGVYGFIDERQAVGRLDPGALWNGGGVPVQPTSSRVSPALKSIRFTLEQAAWTRIRAGIEDGPLLHTCLQWTALDAGTYDLHVPGDLPPPWGSLWSQPDLHVVVASLALPQNAFVVRAPGTNGPRALPDSRATFFPDSAGRRAYLLDDPSIAAEILDARGEPLAVVGDVAYLRVDAESPEDRRSITNSLFEILVYLDGHFLFEEEDGVLPYNFRLDMGTHSEGEHTLLVNMLTDQGAVGATFCTFEVER